MKKILIAATALLVLAIGSAQAAIITYNDKARFLSDTNSANITGTYYPTSESLKPPSNFGGGITFTDYQGLWLSNYSDLMPGLDIGFGYEHFIAKLDSPSYSFGFDIHELVGPRYHDSTFNVTLLNGNTAVGSFSFNAPDNVLFFVGVWSDTLFDAVSIQEDGYNSDDEIFGQFYAGGVQRQDICPDDPSKTEPGICGCGKQDTDSDKDGTADCLDACPTDPGKSTSAGKCGCGVPETDSNGDGIVDCNDPSSKPNIVIYNDKTRFLSDTSAGNITGTYPSGFHGWSPPTNFGGGITFTDYQAVWTWNYSNLIPGQDLGFGYEYFTAKLDTPSYSFGFDIHELIGGQDSTFNVTLFNGSSKVGAFSFNVPDDVLAFVGVWSDALFDKVTVKETVQNDDDEIFGQFYAGGTSRQDACPDDPAKTEPGVCGCGKPDVDTDGDGTADCLDACPADLEKSTSAGQCGCGTADTDSDKDGIADCLDACPDDPAKNKPGACGCGTPDTDSDGNGIADCIQQQDTCPNDPAKTEPGICGCGMPDTDTDGDGTADCLDACPADPKKSTSAGQCGCGTPDTDGDGDGTADCLDACPADPGKSASAGQCGCGTPDADGDGDGTADCLDACPADPGKSASAGQCGCGTPDTDGDGDGTADCLDACPADPGKSTSAGQCGCGTPETDSDEDALPDCIDPPNFSPELLPVGNIQGAEGSPLTLSLSAKDANEEDVLTYKIDFNPSTPEADLPDGASFDAATGVLSWIPGYEQAGNYVNVEASVTDNGSPIGVDAELITITVGDVNRPPVFTPAGAMSVQSRQILRFQVEAADPDGDNLNYTVAGLPNGAVFDLETKTFSWTPSATANGTYVVTFTATDDGTPPATGSLDVAITVNSPPPALQSQSIISDIVAMNLAREVESSYLANLKKVPGFIESGKVGPAINQVQTFAAKVRMDIDDQKIDVVNGQYLLNLAQLLIDSLN